MFEIYVPRQIRRPGADGDLYGPVGESRGYFIKVGKPDWPPRDGPVIHDAAPVVQYFLSLTWIGVHVRRMRFASRFEAANALVHVPAERSDHAHIVVVPHVPIGDDVEPGFLLVANRGGNSVVVHLFVLNFLKRDPNIAAKQLMLVPVRSWKRADHGGRQKGVGNLDCQFLYSFYAA